MRRNATILKSSDYKSVENLSSRTSLGTQKSAIFGGHFDLLIFPDKKCKFKTWLYIWWDCTFCCQLQMIDVTLKFQHRGISTPPNSHVSNPIGNKLNYILITIWKIPFLIPRLSFFEKRKKKILYLLKMKGLRNLDFKTLCTLCIWRYGMSHFVLLQFQHWRGFNQDVVGKMRR